MKNSIVISTTTLPASQDETLGITSINGDLRGLKENQLDAKSEGGGSKTGNLIVNQLMENYGYDASDEDIKRFKENFLNNNSRSAIDGNSKAKSKSTNSIAITRSPNKSNSHGAIFDYSHSMYRTNEKLNDSSDSSSEGKHFPSNKTLFPTFNFGQKVHFKKLQQQ